MENHYVPSSQQRVSSFLLKPEGKYAKAGTEVVSCNPSMCCTCASWLFWIDLILSLREVNRPSSLQRLIKNLSDDVWCQRGRSQNAMQTQLRYLLQWFKKYVQNGNRTCSIMKYINVGRTKWHQDVMVSYIYNVIRDSKLDFFFFFSLPVGRPSLTEH